MLPRFSPGNRGVRGKYQTLLRNKSTNLLKVQRLPFYIQCHGTKKSDHLAKYPLSETREARKKYGNRTKTGVKRALRFQNPCRSVSHWMRRASRRWATGFRVAACDWGVLANSPQPWKRKRKRNFWCAATVKKFHLRLRFQVMGCLLKLRHWSSTQRTTTHPV